MEPTPLTLFRRELGYFSKRCFQGSQFETTVKKNVIFNKGYTEGYGISMEVQNGSMRNPIYDMRYSLNTSGDKLLAVGDEEGYVTMVNEYPSVVTRVQCHRHPVMSIKWSPFQRNLLATGSGDSTVGILQITGGGEIVVLNELRSHSKTVKSVAFNPDSPVLASGGRDGCIFLWDFRCDNSRPINSISNAHTCNQNGASESSSQVADLIFQDCNNLISCGTTDGQIKFWDIRRPYRCLNKKFANKCLGYPSSHSNSKCKGFSSLAISQNILFAASVAHEIFSYDLLSSECCEPVFTYVTPEKLSYYIRIDVSHDGRFLMTGSESENAYIFDTLDGCADPFYTINNGLETVVSATRFHPNNSFKIAIGSDDSAVKFWTCEVTKANATLDHTSVTSKSGTLLPRLHPKYKKLETNQSSMNMESLINNLPNYVIDGQLAHVHNPHRIIRRRTNWLDNAKSLLRPQNQVHVSPAPRAIKLKKRSLNNSPDEKTTKKSKARTPKTPKSASEGISKKRRKSVPNKIDLNKSCIGDYFGVEVVQG